MQKAYYAVLMKWYSHEYETEPANEFENYLLTSTYEHVRIVFQSANYSEAYKKYQWYLQNLSLLRESFEDEEMRESLIEFCTARISPITEWYDPEEDMEFEDEFEDEENC